MVSNFDYCVPLPFMSDYVCLISSNWPSFKDFRTKLNPGGAAPRKSGEASSRAKIFEDPNCLGAWL